MRGRGRTTRLPMWLAGCIGAVALPGTARPDPTTLTLEHLDLAIKVFPDQKRIEGDATLRLAASSPIESLLLDLHPNFHVAEIRVDGHRLGGASWKRSDGVIHINVPATAVADEAIAVRVVYAGLPHVARRPPWEGGMIWSRTGDGTHWIGSSHWGGGCDLLWPCIDHPTRKPAIADLHFTVPSPLVAPANGVLVKITEEEGWRTFHWRARSPHNYGIVINAGPFAVLEARYSSRFGTSIPMKFWYLPGYEEQAGELFEEFPRILAFFESRIGPYPWADEKMGVVQTPYEGMEHQTINAYGNDFEKTAHGFDALLQHEFSHEYFGNQMSVANYDDLWLHEGFASYMQLLFAEYLHGAEDYYAMLKSARSSICNQEPLVAGRERSQNEVYADARGSRADIYSKGSLILHTLRKLVGDDAFFKSIRRLVYGRPDPKPGNFALQFRTTRDFVHIVNEVTGENLSWFFDAYLYEKNLPALQQSRTGETLTLSWKVARSRPFPMPVDVAVDGDNVRVPMTAGRGTLRVPEAAHVVVDPHSKVLRQSDVIDRYQAWLAAQEERSGSAMHRCSGGTERGRRDAAGQPKRTCLVDSARCRMNVLTPAAE